MVLEIVQLNSRRCYQILLMVELDNDLAVGSFYMLHKVERNYPNWKKSTSVVLLTELYLV